MSYRTILSTARSQVPTTCKVTDLPVLSRQITSRLPKSQRHGQNMSNKINRRCLRNSQRHGVEMVNARLFLKKVKKDLLLRKEVMNVVKEKKMNLKNLNNCLTLDFDQF